MINDDIKKPPTFPIDQIELQQLDAFLKSRSSSSDKEVQVTFSKRQWQIICAISSSFLWLTNLLSLKGVGVALIRKVFNISPPPSSKDVPDDQSNDDDVNNDSSKDTDQSKDEDEGSDSCANEPQDESESKGNNIPDNIPSKPRPNHHGKRKSNSFTDPIIIEHNHHNLKKGDKCPLNGCCGQVYLFKRDGKVREVITFKFSPPVQPIVHKMNDFRCNVCLTVFKASLPDDLIKDGAQNERYLYSTQAGLVVLHYGLGMPMRRLEHLQCLFGERLPMSTQFDIFEKVVDSLDCLYTVMEASAANGFVLQGDDVGNRVLSLDSELRERRSDNKIVCRDGVHTSLLISTTHDGHFIPVLETGIIHFGELLDKMMLKRDPELASPLVICDGNSTNTSTVSNCIIGGCWQHSRDYFMESKKHFYADSSVFISLIKEIFEVDRQTHEMNAEQRLEHLQQKALPLVEQLKTKVDDFVTSKKVLPKSTLGVACSYFQGQYHKLILPFKHAGMPIHNNISEWCTYLTVRFLANSKFYKNVFGALVGDRLMMIILFCYLNMVNPYTYLCHCLRNQDDLNKDPEAFFPWKLKDKIPNMAMPSSIRMNFWAPPPPQNPIDAVDDLMTGQEVFSTE